jgi:hypothetical protein
VRGYEPVEAFAAHRADEAFDGCVGDGRADGGAQRLDPEATQGGVDGTGEAGVSIVDEVREGVF